MIFVHLFLLAASAVLVPKVLVGQKQKAMAADGRSASAMIEKRAMILKNICQAGSFTMLGLCFVRCTPPPGRRWTVYISTNGGGYLHDDVVLARAALAADNLPVSRDLSLANVAA